MASYSHLAKRLQSAINQRTETKLLIHTQQWFSEDKGRAVTCYVIKQSFPKIKTTTELFRTYSQVQLVLWLRDYWYAMNGIDIPTDNKVWEKIKNGAEN